MKIIQAMRKIKQLEDKASLYRERIAVYSQDLDIETPVYGEGQRDKVSSWLQGHEDLMREIESLKASIQRTNSSTPITIRIRDVEVTKTITEWIVRRAVTSKLNRQAWSSLGAKKLVDGSMQTSSGEHRNVSVRRYYDPEERDRKVSLFTQEPTLIDGELEVANAITDII